MRTICYRNSEGKCDQCGEKVAFGRVQLCSANAAPTERRKCEWRGVATEDFALIECATCCGNVRKKRPVYDCAIHGACVPYYVGIVAPHRRHRDATLCSNCPLNPATPPSIRLKAEDSNV